MSNKNSQFDQEIDAGKFFLGIFYVFLAIGVIGLLTWFYTSVYKPKEQAYIKGSRYAYTILHKEMKEMYKTQGKVFNERAKNDDAFCWDMVNKYAKNNEGSCNNFNPLSPLQNFVVKGKKITFYGLEKPPFAVDGAWAKDILIDVDGEENGENQVGVDRTILRLYSHGRIGAILTPVNCSREDEAMYGFKKSVYCAGSMEFDYLTYNKPIGFDIDQIGGDGGKTRTVSHNISFIRADCTALGGEITGADDYCDEKMLYELKACDGDDDSVCDIVLSK